MTDQSNASSQKASPATEASKAPDASKEPSSSAASPCAVPGFVPAFAHPLAARILAMEPVRRAVLAAVILAALVFIPWLGAVGLWDCWEVHYGEVAREMVARHDPIYPYWESAHFFSKPPLTMWMQALGIWLSNGLAEGGNGHLGVYLEWGMRLPFALLMILAVAMLTLAVGRVVNPRAGLFSGVALATSPLFFLLARQTVTDTPFVATLTIGLSAFMLAEISPQAVRGRELPDDAEHAEEKKRLVGDSSFWWMVAYAAFGLATLAKGLLGFALPGALLLAYLLVTWDWSMMKRCRLVPGLVVFLLVALPWYLTLSLFDGKDEGSKTFVQRFFIHDHFNRLGKGVHTTTPNTTFTYFIEQLGFAVFPWVPFLPSAFARLTRVDVKAKDPESKGITFIALWAMVAFVVFTLSATKFHHYCFPVVPALAVLAAVALDDVLKSGREDWGKAALLTLAGLALYAVIAHDLWKTPSHLINMYVYKYDRPYPLEEVAPQNAFAVLFGLGGAGMLAGFVARSRKGLVAAAMAFAVAFSVYGSWVHWKNLTFHWSQRDILWVYYENRARADEPIAAYTMNWRGETFYTSNRVRQLRKAEKLYEYLAQPGTLWLMVEQDRYENMAKIVKNRGRDIEIMDRSGNKFYLARATEKAGKGKTP